MTLSEPSRRGGPATVVVVLAWAVVTVIALGAVVVGAVLHWLHRASTPPDVAAVARSAPVDEAGRRAAAMLDDRVAAVVGAAAWEWSSPAALADVCLAEPGSFFGQGFGPVRCTRTVTRVLAFDGDLAARNTEWGRALHTAGFTAHRGLDEPAAAGPGGRDVSYRDAAGVSLEISWGGSGYPPSFHGPPQVIRASDNEVYRAHRPVDGDAAIRDALGRGRHVAVVTVHFTYHAEPDAGGG